MQMTLNFKRTSRTRRTEVDDDLRDRVIDNKGGGYGLLDPESFRLQAPLFAAPDPTGATITALELIIDTIAITPSANEGALNWARNGQLRFLGTAPAPIPLPGGLLLAATALPLLVMHARLE